MSESASSGSIQERNNWGGAAAVENAKVKGKKRTGVPTLRPQLCSYGRLVRQRKQQPAADLAVLAVHTSFVIYLKVSATGSNGRSPSSCDGCFLSIFTGALIFSAPTVLAGGRAGGGTGGSVSRDLLHHPRIRREQQPCYYCLPAASLNASLTLERNLGDSNPRVRPVGEPALCAYRPRARRRRHPPRWRWAGWARCPKHPSG